MIRLTSWCTFFVLWLVLACSASAQSRADADSPGLESGAIVTGVGFVRSGQWSQLRTTVRNPTASDVSLTVVNTFGKSTNLQFGTTLWLPANSRRVIDLPARVSEYEQVEPRKGLDIASMLLSRTSAGREKTWLSREAGQALVESSTGQNISMLGSSEDVLFDLVSMVRQLQESEKGVRTIRSEFAPLTAMAWEPLAAVVISQTPDLNARQLHALRTWLSSGGKVWLMLGDMDPAFASALLGDLWDIAIVDHTRLSRVTFGRTKQAGDEYDQPVTLVRAMPGSATVLSRVGEWPAAMSIPVGKGQVIVTTLDARAWMTKQAKPSLEQVAEILLDRTRPSSTVQDAASELAATRIGRPIVSRTVVLTILILMIVLMTLAGVYFYRTQRLEWMGAVAPGLAILTAMILLGIGKARQGEVPLTISTVNIIRVTPALNQGIAQGSTAVYSPSTEDGPLQATTGGMVWPDLQGLQGRVIRLLVTDIGKWQWQGVEFSSGVIRTGALDQTIQFKEPVSMQGRFGPDGLEVFGKLGSMSSMRDMLLAAPGGVMSLDVASQTAGSPQSDERTFIAGLGNVLPANEYVRASGAILSEEQQQRQAFYRKVFKSTSELPSEPSIIGWVNNLTSGLALDHQHVSQTASLLMIPLNMQRAKAGTQVVVPSTFMPFELVKVPGRRASATIYNKSTNEWIAVTSSVRLALEFTLPDSVLPLEIESATFTLGIRAPGRQVDLYTRAGLKGEPAYSQANPSGKLVYAFGPASGLKPDAQGRIMIIVNVGESPSEDEIWSINSVSLHIQGMALPARSSSRPGR